MNPQNAERLSERLHERSAFATTQWSLVVAAGDSTDSGSQAALSHLCQLYWYPVYVFIRRKGASHEDARDLTQGFFEDFLLRNQFKVANRAIGRFRTFLLSSVDNFLHNQWRHETARKRGGGQLLISLDAERANERFAAEPLDTFAPDVAFDHQWAQDVLDRVTQTLKTEWASHPRSELCQELLAHLDCEPSSVPYSDLCRRFDLTAVNLRVIFHRFRQRYRDLLRLAIRDTVADAAEVDAELQCLIQASRR